MRIAVADDTKEDIQMLQAALQRFGAEHQIDMDISLF